MTVWIAWALAGATVCGLAWKLRATLTEKRRLALAWGRASQQLETLQQAFHRFTPQDVVEDIIRSGVSTRGERLEATILFADLVGFTAMSERMEPEVVVRVLNGYFQRMTQAISSNKGHVGKFIGDGILAMFGAPEPNPWHPQDAAPSQITTGCSPQRAWGRSPSAWGCTRGSWSRASSARASSSSTP